MDLYQHQKEILNKNPARLLVAHGTGSGKTLTAISLADKNCRTCLVITLKDGKERWKREIDKHSNKQCSYTVVTKEEFRRDWNMLPQTEGLIIDECHTFAGMKSQLSKSLRAYLKKHDTPYRWFLSATPVTATPWSVYVLANHLGANLNYYRFMKMFFYEIPMGRRTVLKPNPNKEPELIELIEKIGDMVKLEDVVVVPEQKDIIEYFDLTSEQTEAIQNIDDMEHIVRWTKYDQIESGVLKGNEYEPSQTFECLKNNRIIELTKLNDKVMVFCRYNGQIENLKSLLEHLKRPIFIINGENKDRDATIQQIDKTEKCIVLCNTSCSTGFETPSIHVIIFASFSFDYIQYVQGRGRCLRINKLAPKTYYHLITKGGVNEAVWDCLKNKQSFYIELYNK